MRWKKQKTKKKLPTPSTTAESSNIIHVKSKLGEEFRRFGLNRTKEPPRFENFKALVRQLHGLLNTPFRIRYIDPRDSEPLPITNDNNFEQALKISENMLRIIVERKRDVKNWKQHNDLSLDSMCGLGAGKPQPLAISSPRDCHQVSAIIDVDIVPATHRRVLLHKHDCDKPLGFYIRDGVSSRATSNNSKKQQRGIFISRVVPGGLAESTGLFEVNDEIVEVNGVNIAGMDLDQVTDLMVANCLYLIITLIPINKNTSILPRGGHPSRNRPLCANPDHFNHTNSTSNELEQDEIVDLTAPPISKPHDFRQVSAIIDVDIVPETHRRVRLLKHGSDKPLGFYIRDGTSVRVTPNGLEKQPGIFISRLVPGGLAESTGLLAVNDEVIEVNGIEVAGKTLDQVTDMMVANSSNLIITIKPANQRTLTSPRRGSFSRTSQLSSGSHHTNHTNTSDELEQDDQDEIVDLTGVTLDDNTGSGGGGSANGDGVLHL